MSRNFSVGERVKWKWGDGWGRGEIRRRCVEKISVTIKGTTVTRDASEDEPAYLIRQDDGDQVLKSHSELQAD